MGINIIKSLGRRPKTSEGATSWPAQRAIPSSYILFLFSFLVPKCIKCEGKTKFSFFMPRPVVPSRDFSVAVISLLHFIRPLSILSSSWKMLNTIFWEIEVHSKNYVSWVYKKKNKKNKKYAFQAARRHIPMLLHQQAKSTYSAKLL